MVGTFPLGRLPKILSNALIKNKDVSEVDGI